MTHFLYFSPEIPAVEEEAAPGEAEVEADPAQVALVLTKRQAPELAADCMVYRYGSLATSVDVVRKQTCFLLLWQIIPHLTIECFHENSAV